MPLVFAWAAVTSLEYLQIGIFVAGLLTVAQFSFWGNYLPHVYKNPTLAERIFKEYYAKNGAGPLSLAVAQKCNLGCTYCYARFAHQYVAERSGTPLGTWTLEDFERRIFVKAGAAEISVLPDALSDPAHTETYVAADVIVGVRFFERFF
jgi:sulfatase maturation enzyme AslB (radical SAM superfamily)